MSKQRNENDLKQWLTHLENQYHQEIQLGLTRISQVAQRLKLLPPACKVITVAGTNGKGSTVRALETIYNAAGYKVGSYSSPHLLRFNERIRINLKEIADAELCAAFIAIEKNRGDVPLTYFETVTLAAIWHFNQLPLDIIILEVGLGGRLDATNIIDADVAVITTIDFDHQDYLGDTLEKIAFEKAGILRANKPFVYADLNPPQAILNKAKQLSACAYYFNQDYFMQSHGREWTIKASSFELTLNKPSIQLKSAAAAIMVTRLLQKHLPINDNKIQEAMDDIFIAGRLQFVPGIVDILYDVSHNAQSARLLAEHLMQYRKKNKTIHAVFSALKDKDIFNLIYPLKDCVDRWYPAQLDNKRASSAQLLLAHFKDAEIFIEICYNSPLIAFQAALKQAKAGDLIVVFGSFFTVSQVMASQTL